MKRAQSRQIAHPLAILTGVRCPPRNSASRTGFVLDELGNVQAFGLKVESMNFDKNTRSARWLREMLHEIFQPGQDASSAGRRIGQWTRQGLAVVLSALMILIPMMQGEAFAKAVREDTEVPVPLEDSIRNMAVIEAVFNSARSWQWITPKR